MMNFFVIVGSSVICWRDLNGSCYDLQIAVNIYSFERPSFKLIVQCMTLRSLKGGKIRCELKLWF